MAVTSGGYDMERVTKELLEKIFKVLWPGDVLRWGFPKVQPSGYSSIRDLLLHRWWFLLEVNAELLVSSSSWRMLTTS